MRFEIQFAFASTLGSLSLEDMTVDVLQQVAEVGRGTCLPKDIGVADSHFKVLE